MSPASAPFVLLDDALAGSGTLLSDLVDVAEVRLDTLDAALSEGWARGLHCFVWLPYEAGAAHLGLREDEAFGAVYRFAAREEVDPDAWLASVAPGAPAGPIAPRAACDEETFVERVGAVHDAIRRGETYQINLTFPVEAGYYGHPLDLYRRLRERQPTSYGLAAQLPGPGPRWTLGLSPELFVRVSSDGTIVCQPMKGTAPVAEPGADRALAADPKNRAENVMIVDLLRNDLGQVAEPGSVAVTALFDVAQVGGLWQMTSTVQARALPGTTPGDLMSAAFPCGSITGAPKRSSMALIRALEDAPRRGYTGSMGLIEPAEGPLGWSGCLNVAIRTLELDGTGLRLGVGAGITIGSDPREEYRECLAKAEFLTALPPEFGVIETLRVSDGTAPLLRRHARRLAASARDLGFPAIDAHRILTDAVSLAPSTGAHRVRVEFSPDGGVAVTHAPIPGPPRPDPPLRLLLDPDPWPVDALARFKTTHRSRLDRAWRSAVERGAFDTIGQDASGLILEGGRCALFALIDGAWRTPPLSRGVLDSVARAELLEAGEFAGLPVQEGDIPVAALLSADRILVVNAVIGAREAVL
ncbi:MAG TPA: chorismate-binding protein [Arachnia sp.]|nr:chorismate-binding protein [Arachnia sp.]HMT85426.1 chorismate-binding protein [Arachnia sp.]